MTWTSRRMDRWIALSCKMTLQKISISWVAKRVGFWRRLATTNANACSKQSCAKILAYKKLLRIGSFSACTQHHQSVITINNPQLKQNEGGNCLELGFVPDGLPNRVGGAHGVDGEDAVGGGERGKVDRLGVIIAETVVVGGEGAALEHVVGGSEPGAVVVVVAAQTSHGMCWNRRGKKSNRYGKHEKSKGLDDRGEVWVASNRHLASLLCIFKLPCLVHLKSHGIIVVLNIYNRCVKYLIVNVKIMKIISF